MEGLLRAPGAFYTCSSIERRDDVIAAEPAELAAALGACVRPLHRGGDEVVAAAASAGVAAAATAGSGGGLAGLRGALTGRPPCALLLWTGAGVSAAAGLEVGAMPPPRARTHMDYARAVPIVAPAHLPREAPVHGSLRALAEAAAAAAGCAAFLVTSNVDGALVAGGWDPRALLEVHGSVRRLQCGSYSACGDGTLWPNTGRCCRSCGGPLRVAVCTAADEDDDLALGVFEEQLGNFRQFLAAVRKRGGGGGGVVHVVAGVGPDNADSLLDEVRLVQQHRLPGLAHVVVWLNVVPPPRGGGGTVVLDVRGDLAETLPALAAEWAAAVPPPPPPRGPAAAPRGGGGGGGVVTRAAAAAAAAAAASVS